MVKQIKTADSPPSNHPTRRTNPFPANTLEEWLALYGRRGVKVITMPVTCAKGTGR